MGFRDDLARVAQDPEIRRYAERRAGSRELAEDAIQETYWAVARVKNPQTIRDLRAFFRTAVAREISHQRGRSIPAPIDDIATTIDLHRNYASSSSSVPPSVDSEVALRMLGEELLACLDRHRNQLMASVPRRSPDQRRYGTAIIVVARKILSLLLDGPVSQADWNAILKSEYPQWCDEPDLTRDAIDQRLNRARRDVQLLLRQIARKTNLVTIMQLKTDTTDYKIDHISQLSRCIVPAVPSESRRTTTAALDNKAARWRKEGSARCRRLALDPAFGSSPSPRGRSARSDTAPRACCVASPLHLPAHLT